MQELIGDYSGRLDLMVRAAQWAKADGRKNTKNVGPTTEAQKH